MLWLPTAHAQFDPPTTHAAQPFAAVRSADPWSIPPSAAWTWQLLPDELLYRSYLGSPKEPRLASAWLHERDAGWRWELEVGARVGLVRFGSPPGAPQEGWQLDLWGAAFPRINFEENMDVDATDFHAGVPLTWRQGPLQTKLEIRHMSAHLGDEFLLRNPGFDRRNYVRDGVVLGGGWFPTQDVRLYAEAEYAFRTDGGAEPWLFQFGVDYTPQPAGGWFGWNGTPFLAVNGTLREEVDFGGGLNVVAGWMLRGFESGRLFRIGVQYYNGKSFQYSFFDEHEQLVGVGMWYDY